MLRHILVWLIVGTVVTLVGADSVDANQPEGELVIAFDTSIAATYLDPAETPGLQTPFVFLYALHDALIKPMPGNDMAPSLAESWTESPDGLVYDFKLRQGVTFHNSDPFTAEDAQYSFQRYKGTSAKLLHDKVKGVEVIDAHHLRFVLHAPWPDFLTFYATLATGAAWVVPKRYVERVGADGLKQHPVGLGPYRFVRGSPGVELVLEANENYWRKTPSIKRIIFKGVPERSTRLAMLKTGEADIAYLMIGDEGASIRQDPQLRLAEVIPGAQVQGVVALRGDFCSGGVRAYAVVVTCALMAPLRSLAAGVPHGDCHATDQSGGPLACGAGGGPHAQGGCAHRDLLPSAPCACPLVWPWGRGSAPGDA